MTDLEKSLLQVEQRHPSVDDRPNVLFDEGTELECFRQTAEPYPAIGLLPLVEHPCALIQQLILFSTGGWSRYLPRSAVIL